MDIAPVSNIAHAVGVLWPFHTVLSFGLQSVIVVFPDVTLLFTLIHSFKFQHKSGIRGIIQFLKIE